MSIFNWLWNDSWTDHLQKYDIGAIPWITESFIEKYITTHKRFCNSYIGSAILYGFIIEQTIFSIPKFQAIRYWIIRYGSFYYISILDWFIHGFLTSSWNLDKSFALTGKLGQAHMAKKIFPIFFHARKGLFLLLNLWFSSIELFQNYFSRPLFTIIFRPKIVILDTDFILTVKMTYESVK